MDRYYGLDTHYINILMFGIVFFLIGASFKFIGKNNNSNLRLNKNNNHPVRKIVFYIICMVSIGVYIYDTIQVIPELIAGRTITQIASDGLIKENSSTGFLVFLKRYIANPFSYCISPYAAYKFFSSKTKHPFAYIGLNILAVVLETLRHGGRIALICFGCSYLFGFLLFRKKKGHSFFKYIFLIALIALFVTFSFWISSSRGILDLGDSLSFYFGGTIPHFDTVLKTFDSSVAEYGYGASILYPIVSFFAIPLRSLGLISTPQSMETALYYSSIAEETKLIGPDVLMNAHVSFCYIFYTDFGLIGVIVGAFLWGLFSAFLYSSVKLKNSRNSFITALFILNNAAILTSFVRFQLANYVWLNAILWLYLLFGKEKTKNESSLCLQQFATRD